MKNHFTFIFFFLLIFGSCKNNPKNNQTENNIKKNYFPVADFLNNEISYVDSLPVGILKYTTQGKKTDSAYIISPEFHTIANEFLSDEITTEKFENDFSENSFMDNSTNSATFVYTPKDPKNEIQRIDVLATVSDGSNKVSTLYMEKAFHKNDTLIIKKMLWKSKKNLQIATSKQFGNQAPVDEEVKIVWDAE